MKLTDRITLEHQLSQMPALYEIADTASTKGITNTDIINLMSTLTGSSTEGSDAPLCPNENHLEIEREVFDTLAGVIDAFVEMLAPCSDAAYDNIRSCAEDLKAALAAHLEQEEE